MTEPHPEPANTTQSITDHDSKEMRRLLHDMNNALEIILQASYLLGTVELDEAGHQWLQLLEKGVDQTATLNRQFRDLVVHIQAGHTQGESA